MENNMNIRSKITKKSVIIFGILALICAIGVTYYIHNKKDSAETFQTVTAQTGDITQSVSANGTLNPVVLVSVGTQVSGTVKKLLVDYNDPVRKGQVLAVLDPALFNASIANSQSGVSSAKAALDLAIANERRERELYRQEFVSKQDLDQSVEALKSARAQLDSAHSNLSRDMTNKAYSVIKSPVSGVVIDRQIDEGQTVAASLQTPTLFKIAQDLKNMQIDSAFAEADIGNIKVGQPVTFTVDAYQNRTFKGAVKQIRLNATTTSNVVTYDVVVSVANPDEKLMPGMTAYVNIETASAHNVLTIPNAALRFRPQDAKQRQQTTQTSQANTSALKKHTSELKTIYVLRNNKPTPIRVKVGITDNKYTQIISGLSQTDQVITDETSGGKTYKANTTPPRMF